MTISTTASRRLGVAAAATAAALLVTALALPEVVAALDSVRNGSWRTASFEELLVRLCAVTALAAGASWWSGVLRLVAAARPGVDTARVPTPAGVPPWLRRLVLAACGAVLVVGPTTPALASGGGDAADPADPAGPARDPVAALVLPPVTGDRPTAGPGGLPLPDRVAGAPPVRPPGQPAARERARDRPAPTTVRVTTGDSLWRIAEAQLRAEGAPACDADVSERWQRIYAANVPRIGPDPDLLLPGQELDLGSP